MDKQVIEFAKKLIEIIRDRTIRSCNSQLNKKSNSPIAKRWREYSENLEDLQKAIIIDCVDNTLFNLLNAIDNKELILNYITNEGTEINLSEIGIGELSGWYAGNEWKEQFSKEKYFDDFSDLSLD